MHRDQLIGLFIFCDLYLQIIISKLASAENSTAQQAILLTATVATAAYPLFYSPLNCTFI